MAVFVHTARADHQTAAVVRLGARKSVRATILASCAWGTACVAGAKGLGAAY